MKKLKRLISLALVCFMIVTADAGSIFAAELPEENKPLVNYLLVQEPYLETPGKQTVMIGIGDGSAAIDSAVLTYRNEQTDRMYETEATEILNDFVLFEMEYTNDSDAGTYRLEEISYSAEGTKSTASFKEMGIEASFGVDRIAENEPDDVFLSDEEVEALAAESEMSIVSLDENGDREFNFYRKQSCDLMLDKSEIPENLMKQGDILHFCSVGLVESPSKYAHIKAIECAKANNCIVSFDVNVRERLWDSVDNCVKTIKEFLTYADIVKVTDEELVLLTGEKQESKAVSMLLEIANNAKLLVLTKGGAGAAVYDRIGNNYFSKAADVKVVDTTGAGDCFIGCLLYKMNSGQATLTVDGIKDAMDFASLGCGVVIGKKGAIESMPTIDDIQNLKISLSK